MKKIDKRCMDATVAIGVATCNSQSKFWIGTGFLVGFTNWQGGKEVYLLTNKHVVLNQQMLYIRFNCLSSQAKDFPLQIKNSQGVFQLSIHPKENVDIVAISINVGFLENTGAAFDYFDLKDNALVADALNNGGYGEGSCVYAIGYPMNLVGQEKQYPICRQGCISRIADVYEHRSIEYLIDAQTFPGNSGGPVVVNDDLTTSGMTRLIGILRAYIPYQENLVSQQTGRQRSLMEENSGLTVVHTVDIILETVKMEQDRVLMAAGQSPRMKLFV